MPKDRIKPILPPRLFPGDAVGIIAPASPFDKNRFLRGISVIESMGFRPVYSDEIYETKRYLAGEDVHRAGVLNAAFADRGIKAVWCARGGYGSLRLLSLIDYESVRSNPKVFIGCSDISAILNMLYFRCGLVSFHGPMVESLGDADDLTLKSLSDLFLSDRRLTLQPSAGVVIRPGTAAGVVSGGNLTTLCHLTGTPHEPDFSGHILFLEDTNEAPYRIDRMLTQMRLAGCFNRVAGIMLGSFRNCGEPDDIIDVVADVFSGLDFPILFGFDIGHGWPNLTIPIGIEAVLNTAEKKLLFQQTPFVNSPAD